ncbi:PilW family protein [Clostridium sp. BJN0013]|uniref:PilW family protein n=1 Tax=Clostridium sp. BJN0013 TaxID=3236840 RepID=UPI0034C6C509
MKKKGFTLIELMIALSIFVIFSIYLYKTFFSQIKQSFNFNNNIDVQYNVNKALNMLTDEIRSYNCTNDTKIFKSSDSNNSFFVNCGNGDSEEGNIDTSNSRDTIDLLSNSPESGSPPPSDIQYNRKSKTLYLKNDNQNKCFNIDSVFFLYENGLITVTVSASRGDVHIERSTAINLKN